MAQDGTTSHPPHDIAAPTPEEVGKMYDTFGEMLALTQGSSALHIGMFVPPGQYPPVDSLAGLADLAQDVQTDHLIDTLALSPDAALLDIGCGTGGPALRLARRSGCRVTGITVSGSQVDICRRRAEEEGLAERVEFDYGNAMELAYADASFDAAWSIDCLPHLSDRRAALREACRVLRPGGHLLITEMTVRGVPDRTGLEAYTRLWSSRSPGTFAALAGDIEAAGLAVVQTQDMTSNAKLAGDLMHLLYQDRRAEIEERFGAGMTRETDPVMAPFRDFCRDHLEYHLLLLRRPEVA